MTRIFYKIISTEFNGVTVVETSRWTLLGVLGEGCPRPLLQSELFFKDTGRLGITAKWFERM